MASPRQDLRIGDDFSIGDRIGVGSFGAVFEGRCLRTDDPVAIKIEPKDSTHPVLGHEARVYQLLNANGGIAGVPKLRWCGSQGAYHVMVIDLLGPSLEKMYDLNDRHFGTSTLCALADQLLTRLEQIHRKGLLHRDIKPDNLLVGLGEHSDEIFLVDFGLSKPYCTPSARLTPKKPLVGTARYASINSHLGLEQSWRDDLESLGYVLLYFARGRLPWQGLPVDPHDPNYMNIANKKIETPLCDLCQGLPAAFEAYMRAVRALKQHQRPDYVALRAIFQGARDALGADAEEPFEWRLRPSSSECGLTASEAAASTDAS